MGPQDSTGPMFNSSRYPAGSIESDLSQSTEKQMAPNPAPDDQLQHPDRIVGPDGTRDDGRPTETEEDPTSPTHQVNNFPTVAPEEEGQEPPTEHAPGADL